MIYFLTFFIIISLLGFLLAGVMFWQIVRMSASAQLYQFTQKYRYPLWVVYYALFVAVPPVAMLAYILSGNYFHPLLSLLYTSTSWGLLLGGYLLMGTVTAWMIGICCVVVRHFKKIEKLSWRNVLLPFLRDFTPLQKGIILLPVICAIGLVMYGTINASTIRITHHNLSASSGVYPLPSSWIGKNIILYSDTHIGTVRSKRFLTRVVENINNNNPYITLMAGDLVDGPRFPHHYLEPFGNLRAEAGNYFTPGNHEEYSRDPEISKTIDQYLTRVSDSTTVVDGVTLIGMSYNREPMDTFVTRLDQVISRNPAVTTMPSIGILHDPTNIRGLLNLSPNLTVSGHTHGGQIWPGTLLVKKIYGVFAYGPTLHNDNKTLHITTSGVGTAQSPVRIGTRAEIVVIRVVE